MPQPWPSPGKPPGAWRRALPLHYGFLRFHSTLFSDSCPGKSPALLSSTGRSLMGWRARKVHYRLTPFDQLNLITYLFVKALILNYAECVFWNAVRILPICILNFEEWRRKFTIFFPKAIKSLKWDVENFPSHLSVNESCQVVKHLDIVCLPISCQLRPGTCWEKFTQICRGRDPGTLITKKGGGVVTKVHSDT